MVPLALALLAIVLGGAGLYFGLTANQQLAPIAESIDAGSSSAARIDKQLSSLETRLAEVSAQNNELTKTVERLRVYGSQSEQVAKQAASGVKSNREELVKLAQKMNELATSGAPGPAPARVSSGGGSGGSGGDSAGPPATSGAASTYVIKSGDTFAKIASQQGVSLDALLAANPGTDPRRLSIGQTIKIPAN